MPAIPGMGGFNPTAGGVPTAPANNTATAKPPAPAPVAATPAPAPQAGWQGRMGNLQGQQAPPSMVGRPAVMPTQTTLPQYVPQGQPGYGQPQRDYTSAPIQQAPPQYGTGYMPQPPPQGRPGYDPGYMPQPPSQGRPGYMPQRPPTSLAPGGGYGASERRPGAPMQYGQRPRLDQLREQYNQRGKPTASRFNLGMNQMNTWQQRMSGGMRGNPQAPGMNEAMAEQRKLYGGGGAPQQAMPNPQGVNPGQSARGLMQRGYF